jgi:HAD superfamily hydrolase (TIGR01450 family)
MPSKTAFNISEIIHEHPFTTFLVDASGVIYNEDGVIDTAASTIQSLQKVGRVFLVTNNSYMNPSIIQDNLMRYNIQLATNHIISSGHGLKDVKEIHAHIKNKNCYVFGRESSYKYIIDAQGRIVSDIKNAQAIILTASLRENTEEEFQKVLSYCLKHPTTPIVCCNPDRYVKGEGTDLIKVIGYWAERLEKSIGRPINWIGKPLRNFSHMLEKKLLNAGITVDKRILFFDDNHENVINLQNDIGISGCIIKNTGLSHHRSLAELQINQQQADYILPQLQF